MRSTIRPLWSPLVAGIALGLVLLMTFLITGHGLGASGFFTRFTAWLGGELMRPATLANAYLGPFLKAATGPLANWISWEIVGVMIGAALAAAAGGRFRLRLDGAKNVGGTSRIAFALAGGVLSGFGARLARGCTSGLGLSGGATLAVAAFLFLIGFFIGGIVIGYLVRRAWA
ncbi:MAG TPA: YeeE/YedE thiosulfate transporter family protein [Pseudolabrys sp.]|nr:YeeE/YedE thiosulfate transporter family protein [Pseudolabrys sp.]